MRTAGTIGVILLMAGCGAESPDTESAAETVELTPRDTIGIEIGDSCYTFGVIGAAEYTTTGNIAVGDISVMRMRLYSPDGTYIGSGGSSGEGPGEYAYPTGAFPTAGGGIAVTDAMGGKVIFYDSLLTFDHEVLGFVPNTPQLVTVLGDGALVGSTFTFDQETMEVRNSLQRWEEGETEASVTYLTRAAVYDPSDPMAVFEGLAIHACALPDGRVVAAPLSTDEYVLTCYLPDGGVDWVTERPFERTRRDEEVIETDRELMRAAAERNGGSVAMVDELPIPEWSHSIAGLQTDGSRIWVRRDGSMVPEYDVFDFEGGFLFPCEVPGLPYAAGINIRFSPFGALAFEVDPADFSKVILIDLPGLPAGGPRLSLATSLAGSVPASPESDLPTTASPGLTSCTLQVAADIEPLLISVYWTTGEGLPDGFASAHTVMTAPLSGGEADRFQVDTRFHADLDPSGWFVVEDMNFDGFLDFRLMESPSAGPDTYWLFWLFDPGSGRFRRASEWESAGLVSPEFDPVERTIRSFSRGGYGLYTTTWFVVEDGIPEPVRMEITEPGEGDSLFLVTMERIDGVMTETGREPAW